MRIAVIGLAAIVTTLAILALLGCQSTDRVVMASFWFEDGAFEADEFQLDRLGHAITPEERRTIESLAWSELRAAYAGLRVVFAEHRDASYRVRVARELKHPLWQFNALGVAGESRFVWPLGGRGAVSFRVLAGNAIAFAPPHADRAAIVDGIGRGIGRAAAHEFAHQFLPRAPIHASTDVRSYEYPSAGRAEQYYSSMHWDLVAVLLAKRLGVMRGVGADSRLAQPN